MELRERGIVVGDVIPLRIPLAIGSDGGPREQNPFLNLMLAVVFPNEPAEALTREQALTAYTAGGAYRRGRRAA
jgi:predicted amidohydrolase YtcJ